MYVDCGVGINISCMLGNQDSIFLPFLVNQKKSPFLKYSPSTYLNKERNYRSCFVSSNSASKKKSLWSSFKKKRNELNQEPSFIFRERSRMLDEKDSITNHNSMKWKKQEFKNLPISWGNVYYSVKGDNI